MSANLGDATLALDTRSSFILSLNDCKLDDKKKCAMENEVQDILEALERPCEVPVKDVPFVAPEVASERLEQGHDFLPRLSDKVEVEYDPTRGRFAVANK